MESFSDFMLNLAPQLLLAGWIIWRDGKTIDKHVEMEKWMLEQLMSLHPPQKKDDSPVEKIP